MAVVVAAAVTGVVTIGRMIDPRIDIQFAAATAIIAPAALVQRQRTAGVRTASHGTDAADPDGQPEQKQRETNAERAIHRKTGDDGDGKFVKFLIDRLIGKLEHSSPIRP